MSVTKGTVEIIGQDRKVQVRLLVRGGCLEVSELITITIKRIADPFAPCRCGPNRLH